MISTGRYTDEQTHHIMSSVHSKNTNIEICLCKALWAKGYRFRKNVSSLPGKPDISIKKYKIVVFCDAEFWHGKDWEIRKAKLAKGKNPEFWISKIEHNRERDRKNNETYEAMGWTVIRLWGNDILKDTEKCVQTVSNAIEIAKRAHTKHTPD